eukprot:10538738-Heterocapsa_arctica.AAC.1
MAITGGDNRAVLGALAPIEGAASSAGAQSPSSAAAQTPSSVAAQTPSSAGAQAPTPCMAAHADACLGPDVGQTEDADW